MIILSEISWTLPISNPLLTFSVLMLIILLAPLVIERLRGPGMVGLILAGILVGPNALQLLDRSETIVLLGQVGLLYIMFIAGLEIDLHQFKKYRNHSLVFGAATFLIPQLLGTAMALWFLDFGWAAAILLASMFASHTLLPYPIISRLGLSRNRAVTTTVGGTIITDTAALLVLAIVASSTRGELNSMFWITLTVSLTVYTSVVWWGLPKLGRWFFTVVPAEGIAHFVFVIAAMFFCAFFAEVAGVEAIIGAFLAGLTLNRLVPHQSVMMSRIEFAGQWLFIPIFLISVGMLVDPRVLFSDFAALKVCIAMVATVTLTKFAAAWISARLLGYNSQESFVMFGLSVNQAAATLAAVMIGFKLGIFDEAVLNGAIMMILVTCILGPWMTQKYGRQLAQQKVGLSAEDIGMRPRILIPLRNPQGAEGILNVSFMIRPKESDEPIYPLTVVQDIGDASEQLAVTERMLGHAVIHAVSASVPVVPTIRLDTNSAEGIIRAARELRVSTVVMGWGGGGMAHNRIFGTVLDQLLDRCFQQLIVCRLVRDLNTCERLVLAIPPFAYLETGFSQSIQTIKTLVQSASMNLVISAAKSEIDAATRRIAAVSPSVPIETMSVESFDDWLDPFNQKLRDHDLVVLLAARRQQASWCSSLDRIPKIMASLSPKLNMMVVYPSEESADSRSVFENTGIATYDLKRLFDQSRIAVKISNTDAKAVLVTLLSGHFQGQPSYVEQLSRELLSKAESAPIDIATGTILLHAHPALVKQPIAFLATLGESTRFSQLDHSHSSKIVLVLLSPASLTASDHLQYLARIARSLHDYADVAAIENSSNPNEILSLLNSV